MGFFMVMGFVLVMVGLFFIGGFLGVCFLFFRLLLVLFIGWVLGGVEGMLRLVLVCFCRFVCFFAVVWLMFCGLFFGVVVYLVMVLFGGGCLGLGCLVFGIVVHSCFCCVVFPCLLFCFGF